MSFESEEKLSLFPQCILEDMMMMVMMTSLLADKSVMLKIKKIMNFMNEIINPPCNSFLATFFEAVRKVCPKTVSSSLRRSIRFKWTINQLFKLLFPLPPVVFPEENVAGERGEESPVGGLEGPIEAGGVCETEAGTEVDAEDEDENVDVVGGVDEVGLSGYESEGFTLSEILRRKRLWKNVCPRVSLTPLTFHNVSFQIFIDYH